MDAAGWYTAKHFFPSCRKGGFSWGAQRMNSHRPPSKPSFLPSHSPRRNPPPFFQVCSIFKRGWTSPNTARPRHIMQKQLKASPGPAWHAWFLLATYKVFFPTFPLAHAQDSLTVLPAQDVCVAPSVYQVSQLLSARTITGFHDRGAALSPNLFFLLSPRTLTHILLVQLACSTRVYSGKLALSPHWAVGHLRAGPLL